MVTVGIFTLVWAFLSSLLLWFGLRLVNRHVTTWKASHSHSKLVQVILTVRWSYRHLILCHAQLLFLNLSNSLTENLILEDCLPYTQTRRVIWRWYYTLPIIVCFPPYVFIFPDLAGSLWGVIIFSWEALISPRPLTSLDATLSSRFPPWPHHKWQILY